MPRTQNSKSECNGDEDSPISSGEEVDWDAEEANALKNLDALLESDCKQKAPNGHALLANGHNKGIEDSTRNTETLSPNPGSDNPQHFTIHSHGPSPMKGPQTEAEHLSDLKAGDVVKSAEESWHTFFLRPLPCCGSASRRNDHQLSQDQPVPNDSRAASGPSDEPIPPEVVWQRLQKLMEWKDAGMLTDEEFSNAKGILGI